MAVPEEVDVKCGHQEGLGFLSPQVQELLVALEAAPKEPPLPPMRQADLARNSCVRAVLQVPVRSAIASIDSLLGTHASRGPCLAIKAPGLPSSTDMPLTARQGVYTDQVEESWRVQLPPCCLSLRHIQTQGD